MASTTIYKFLALISTIALVLLAFYDIQTRKEVWKAEDVPRESGASRRRNGHHIAMDMLPKEARVAERFQKICAANLS
jgi:hypothetical protein